MADFGWTGDRTAIARIESGKRSVSVDELFQLAAALDTAPSLLLTPEDESELMWPTPQRAMTSNRVRAWITDNVRIWEQDNEAFTMNSNAAWTLTRASEDEFARLAGLLAAIHGVKSPEDIDPEQLLSEKASADSAILDLRFEVAYRRHNWESYVGAWPWTDISEDFVPLDQDTVLATAIAQGLWNSTPLEEIQRRQTGPDEERITTAEQAAASLRAIVQASIDVIKELAAEVRAATSASPAPRTRPPTRRDKQAPA
jgi:transcriptional regulator with XRE-family HTH domain